MGSLDGLQKPANGALNRIRRVKVRSLFKSLSGFSVHTPVASIIFECLVALHQLHALNGNEVSSLKTLESAEMTKMLMLCSGSHPI